MASPGLGNFGDLTSLAGAAAAVAARRFSSQLIRSTSWLAILSCTTPYWKSVSSLPGAKFKVSRTKASNSSLSISSSVVMFQFWTTKFPNNRPRGELASCGNSALIKPLNDAFVNGKSLHDKGDEGNIPASPSQRDKPD